MEDLNIYRPTMYEKYILENGIRVVTDTMPEVRSIAVGVMINAGPRDEIYSQTGLAHLVEHVMFQGTHNRSAVEIARLMDEAGGRMGAFTTRDYTCYLATVLDEYCTYFLDLIGDIMLNSVFPTDKIEKEKGAILSEIDEGRDIPHERVHALLKAFVWPDHPLGRSISGCPEAVKSLTRPDIVNFVKEHYLPTRMIVAAAGNINHDEFVASVRDALWQMPKKFKPVKRHPLKYHSGVVIEHMAVTQAYFCIGIEALPYAHPERYAMHIFNTVLGGGVSSRLFRRLREERGLVYNIYSEYHAYWEGGILTIEGSTSPEYLMDVLEMILVELSRLIVMEDPVREEEFWKAKMHLRGQHIISMENTNSRMSSLSTQEFYFKRYIPSNEIVGEIEAVDGDSLKHMFENHLEAALSRISIAVVGPEAPMYYTTETLERLQQRFR